MLIYYNKNYTQNVKNVVYPDCVFATVLEQFELCFAYDHVCGIFKDNTRLNENWIKSDFVEMDFDNDSKDGVLSKEQLKALLGNTKYVLCESRNCNKEKHGVIAYRVHVYFPLSKEYTDPQQFMALRKGILAKYGIFDCNADKLGQLIFGVSNPQVEIHNPDGTYIDRLIDPTIMVIPERKTATVPRTFTVNIADCDDTEPAPIPVVKSQNIAILPWVEHVLSQVDPATLDYTEWEEVLAAVHNISGGAVAGMELCDKWSARDTERYKPNEVSYKWTTFSDANSKEYLVGKPRLIEIATAHGYVNPLDGMQAEYVQQAVASNNSTGLVAVMPPDDKLLPRIDMLTEKGLAYKTKEILGSGLAYTKEYGWLAFKGVVYVPDNDAGFTAVNWVADRIIGYVRKMDTSVIEPAEHKQYCSFVRKCGSSSFLDGAERILKTLCRRSILDFDTDASVINCSGVIVNKKDGSVREMFASDLLCKSCRYKPSMDGMDIWLDFLHEIIVQEDGHTFDPQVCDYIQRLMGLMLWGKGERFIIAHGESGANGKSTLFESILGVLNPELDIEGFATYGKKTRFLSNPERRFSTAQLKGVLLALDIDLKDGCMPTDDDIKSIFAPRGDTISAEIKGGATFQFKPTHTYVACTNNTPNIKAVDPATWERITRIMFYHPSMKRDPSFGERLLNTCGGAIMQWLIDGAVWVYQNGYLKKELPVPVAVQQANEEYRKKQGLPQRIVSALDLVVDGTGEIDIQQAYREYLNTEYCLNKTFDGEYIVPKDKERTTSWLIEQFQKAYRDKFKLGKRRTHIGGVYGYMLTGVHKP